MNQHSLLAHLVPRLTIQTENLATESLVYLLRRYRMAREIFVNLVSAMGCVVPGDLEFSTQVRMQHGSIPDLVGATSDGTGVLLVESKFWAPLTPNQPTGYLHRLPTNREGTVLFVAPEGRYEALWQELSTRCHREGLELREEVGEPPNWRAARVLEMGQLAYTSWSFVLDRLEGRLKEAEQDQAAHEVWQLRGLCRRLEAPPELEADSWEELGSIVREVTKHLSERGVLDTRGYGVARGPRSYRRYGTLAGHKDWFVGYNEEYALRFGEPLLWVGGPSGDMRPRKSLPIAEEYPLRSYELNNEVLFPTNVPIEAARGLVVQSLITQVEVIAELLRKRGSS